MSRLLTKLAATATLSLLLLAPGSAAWSQEGDATKGENVFKKCMTCHRVGDGAKSQVGPVLNGVIGRQAGTFEGYSYSPLNKTSGESGLVWNEQLIFEYLPDPNEFLKKYLASKGKTASGSTKMIFKLPSESERRDVIAYLKKFSK